MCYFKWPMWVCGHLQINAERNNYASFVPCELWKERYNVNDTTAPRLCPKGENKYDQGSENHITFTRCNSVDKCELWEDLLYEICWKCCKCGSVRKNKGTQCPNGSCKEILCDDCVYAPHDPTMWKRQQKVLEKDPRWSWMKLHKLKKQPQFGSHTGKAWPSDNPPLASPVTQTPWNPQVQLPRTVTWGPIHVPATAPLEQAPPRNPAPQMPPQMPPQQPQPSQPQYQTAFQDIAEPQYQYNYAGMPGGPRPMGDYGLHSRGGHALTQASYSNPYGQAPQLASQQQAQDEEESMFVEQEFPQEEPSLPAVASPEPQAPQENPQQRPYEGDQRFRWSQPTSGDRPGKYKAQLRGFSDPDTWDLERQFNDRELRDEEDDQSNRKKKRFRR